MIMNDDLGNPLSQMMISHIVMEKLGFHKVCAQWVPHQLSPEYKTNRMAVTLDFLERYKRDVEEMLSMIVRGDETWVHHFTPSTKKKSMVWKEVKEPSPKKFKTVLSSNKVMCTVFWDAKGIIWQEYLLKRTTINAERYCKTLKNLRKAVKRKRRGLLTEGVML